MWFLGHVALGCFAAFAVGKLTGERISFPLVCLISVLPDVDLLLESLIVHRGPTHSVVLAAVVFSVFYLWTHRGLPYFAAILTHSLIGDYLTGPTQLLWPLPGWFAAAPPFQLSGEVELVVEVSLFVIMIVVVVLSGRGTGALGRGQVVPEVCQVRGQLVTRPLISLKCLSSETRLHPRLRVVAAMMLSASGILYLLLISAPVTAIS